MICHGALMFPALPEKPLSGMAISPNWLRLFMP
jgi:hypothetical protein